MSGFTSVTSALTVGQIGQLAHEHIHARSYVLQDATAVPPGRAVVYDAANDSAMLPSGAGQKFLGIVFDDKSLAIESAAYDAAGLPNMPVAESGVVWVLTSEAVTPGDAVYFQHDGTGAGAAGSFRTDNNGGKATEIAYGCKWFGSYASGKAALQVNLPA